MNRALQLNLASRPFRNNVPIWTTHAVIATALALYTAWNVHTFLDAGDKLASVEATIGSSEAQLLDLDRRDREAVQGIRIFDPKTIDLQAEKANDIIQRRGFSWTQLFNLFEKIVPYEVRMTAIRPVYGTREAVARNRGRSFEGTVPIDVEGAAQSLEAFLEFERALIVDHHFAEVEPVRTEQQEGNPELKFALHFLYDPEGKIGDERPKLPHVLDAAKKAAAEGGEAPASAVENLP
ncbi:MAG TPA: hypothetical protein VJ826_02430 [Candidatus Polarisedimenticolaceae bacterium]|nr:hypothetical protein [Candidatus Polarisedimenticolaceae bacterium]